MIHRKLHLFAETGQSTVDYAGVGLIIVAIVAVVASSIAGTSTDIGHMIMCKVGSIVSQIGGGEPLSCETGDQAQAPAEHEQDPMAPTSCQASSSTVSSSSYIKLGFIKLGDSFSLVQQKENYIDPATGEIKTRYSVVATDGTDIGATGGFGTKGEINGSGLGADLSGDAGFSVKSGDTWEFDSEEEMQSFLEDYRKYRIQKGQTNDHYGTGSTFFPSLAGGVAGPPAGADMSSISNGVNIKGKGESGFRTGEDKEESESFNPNIGVHAELSGGESQSHKTDHREGHEGEYTDTVTYTGSVEGGGDAAFTGVARADSYEGAMSVTRDKDDTLTSISFTQKTSSEEKTTGTNGPAKGGGGVTGSGSASDADKQTNITTTTLPVTDANRATVEQWLTQAYDADQNTGEGTLILPPNVLHPDSPVPDDPMQQLLYDEATSSTSTYDVSGDDLSVSGDVAAGLKIGAGVTMSSEDTTLVEQTYLGDHQSEGATRPSKEADLCTEQ